MNTIYSQTDVVVACYENSNLNERIAEPNKMYEAILYCKPIVVQKGTFVADRVLEYQCGYAIDAYSDAEIERFINGLTANKLAAISEKERCVEMADLIDNPMDIINKLKRID